MVCGSTKMDSTERTGENDLSRQILDHNPDSRQIGRNREGDKPRERGRSPDSHRGIDHREIGIPVDKASGKSTLETPTQNLDLRLRRGTCHAIIHSRDPRHQASGLAGLEMEKRSEPFVLRTRVRGSRGVGVRHIGFFEYTELLSLVIAIRDLPTRSGSSIRCGRVAIIQTIGKVPIEESSIGNRDSGNRESRGQGFHAL
jgi:hypothetical protein